MQDTVLPIFLSRSYEFNKLINIAGKFIGAERVMLVRANSNEFFQDTFIDFKASFGEFMFKLIPFI